MFSLSDYNYSLPSELIAQTPANPPESCKLLVYDKETWVIQDKIFSSFPKLIDPKTLVIFNNSKVLKARIPLWSSNWNGEIFFLKQLDEYRFEAMVGGRKFKVGSTIDLNEEVSFFVESIIFEWRILHCNKPILEVLERCGNMPLPPYITHTKEKEKHYQAVTAKHPGSVAAPTASLHFTDDLIQQIKDQWSIIRYTTLHIGTGTFKPVLDEDITKHAIHEERIIMKQSMFQDIEQAKNTDINILTVGTTVTRSLESLVYVYVLIKNDKNFQYASDFRDDLAKDITPEKARSIISELQIIWASITFDSRVYIYPGFEFTVIDQLLTNFHLPMTSLLMLVAWFVWYDQVMKIYQHAIQQEYQFYSFGDAMLLR